MLDNPTVVTFFGLILWPMILLIIMGTLRIGLSLSGKRAANSFSPTGEDVSPFAARLSRTHANCYEFLPFILALLLFAIAKDATALTDPLALVMLGARIGQSVTHLTSTSNAAVTLRFFFFLPQVAIAVFWVFVLYQSA